jgi:hypothetical protein
MDSPAECTRVIGRRCQSGRRARDWAANGGPARMARLAALPQLLQAVHFLQEVRADRCARGAPGQLARVPRRVCESAGRGFAGARARHRLRAGTTTAETAAVTSAARARRKRSPSPRCHDGARVLARLRRLCESTPCAVRLRRRRPCLRQVLRAGPVGRQGARSHARGIGACAGLHAHR